MLKGHGGNIYELARELNCPPDTIIDMSSNVNPLGPMPEMMDFLREQMGDVTRLPEVNAKGIVNLFAGALGVDPERVMAANGSTWFIHMLPLALKSKRALIIGPTYSDYAAGCRMHNVEHRFWHSLPDNGFQPGLQALDKALAGFDTVFICNPNNPTGALIPCGEVLDLFTRHPEVVFVVDEAYLPFVAGGAEASVATCGLPNVVVLTSMSKIFRIPGLRIGFMVSSVPVIQKMIRYALPWCVSALAQAAVAWVLTHRAAADMFVEKTVEFVTAQRAIVAQDLEAVAGLTVFPSKTDFTLVQLPEGLTAETVCAALAADRMLIRNCANFKGLSNRFVRISLKKEDVNRELVRKLTEICG
jgi:threonine-phosphate decarboxylase